jgi:hypothetical protein
MDSRDLSVYRAYLLRMWQEPTGPPYACPVWRFSLQNTAGDPRRGFASLEALIEFLKQEIEIDQSNPDRI